MAQADPKTRILYDGNCVVCDLEISHYKRLAPDLFELLDISAPDFNAAAYSLTTEAVERDLHVFTPAGELKKGVDAFAHIWDRLEKYRWLSRGIRLPGIYSTAKIGYKIFTVVRPYLPKKIRR